MRSVILWMCVACSPGPAQAGDLWMDLDVTTGGDQIRLHLPANWLADADEPVKVDTATGPIDLSAAARSLRTREVGSKATWRLEEGTLELHHLRLKGTAATGLAINTRGPKGHGLTMTMELEPDQVRVASGQLAGVVDVNGQHIDVDRALCDQLKASPPVTVMQTTGPKGGGITVSTE